MEVLDNYRYTENHEWIKLEGDVAYIGITFIAQKELGEIVHVELPDVGVFINAGDPLGSLEAVKTVEDIYSPISGEIEKINNDLFDNPEIINKSPYEDGWLVKIRFSNPTEIDDLLTPEEYRKHVQ